MAEIGKLLSAVERVNAALALLVLVGGVAWLGIGLAFASLAGGAVLGAVNVRAMHWMASRLTAGAAKGSDASQAGYMLLFVAKLGALMALCYVLVVLVEIAVVPFMVGLSTVPLALLGGAWWSMVRSSEPPPAPQPPFGASSTPSSKEASA